MAAVRDLSAWLADADGWHVEGIPSAKHPKGREYLIPSPTAGDGMKIRRLHLLTEQAGGTTTSEMTALTAEICDQPGGPVELERVLLGSALDEMVAEGVSAAHLQVVAGLAFLRWALGEHAVVDLVQATSPKKAPPAKRSAPRKAPAKKVAPRKAPARKAI